MEGSQAELEAALRDAIRTSLEKLPWRTFSVQEVARHLANEVVAGSKRDTQGRLFAPDQFTLSIHPHETGELHRSPPEIQLDLAEAIKTVLEENGFIFSREPHVTLATDPTLKRGEVRVITWHSREPVATSDQLQDAEPIPIERTGVSAFLVVQGRGHLALEKPVTRIGRQPDNDLVLSDPHVSRKHAEVRAEGGRFKIVDLHSTSGTRVNGTLVGEQFLYPGDVLLLASVELVYGEAISGPPGGTSPYQPKPRTPSDTDQVTPLDLRTLRLIDPLTDPPEETTD